MVRIHLPCGEFFIANSGVKVTRIHPFSGVFFTSFQASGKGLFLAASGEISQQPVPHIATILRRYTSPCRKAEAEPSVCLVLRSPCCSSLAASSGMAFLGGLHCLGTRLRGNADCSTHHSSFHPLPALRKRRALFCSANSGRTKKAGYRHHAGMPGLRFHLLHGRLFALAGKNYPPAPHLPGRMGRKICP